MGIDNIVRINSLWHYRTCINLLVFISLFFLYTVPVSAQNTIVASDIPPGRDDPQRTQDIDPFRIIGNIYSVGIRIQYPVFLITTEAGNILLDTAFEESVPDIISNIREIGFSESDIKLMLMTHAHHDHVGGHSLMQEYTGATILSSAPDADVIESGGKTDFRDTDPWTPAKVDRTFDDLEKIQLGTTILTAHITAGHTKGCTTWTMEVEENEQKYDVVFLCGMRMNAGEQILDNPDYPEMAQDFAYGFAKLKILPVDVVLGGHGYWFDMQEKMERMKSGATVNPFIDPDGYHKTVAMWEKAYLQQLSIERKIGAN